MSKTLVIVAHPNLTNSRINKRWVEALRQHPEHITVHDLHASYPDGRIDAPAERALIEAHQHIVFQFPMFWFSTPAFLKQWIDEVVTFGWAYGPGGDKFEGKSLMLAYSTGGTVEAYQAGGQNHFSPSELTKWLELTAIFVRAKFLPSHILHGAGHGLSDEALEESTKAYISRLVKSEVNS
ncbi:TPA: NAD(P)H-dependent oxidoreductase [Enterobacter cloacae]|nr:NAD(P)H-dependent oxidoreductase [Enterobacter cloacae]